MVIYYTQRKTNFLKGGEPEIIFSKFNLFKIIILANEICPSLKTMAGGGIECGRRGWVGEGRIMGKIWTTVIEQQ